MLQTDSYAPGHVSKKLKHHSIIIDCCDIHWNVPADAHSSGYFNMHLFCIYPSPFYKGHIFSPPRARLGFKPSSL